MHYRSLSLVSFLFLVLFLAFGSLPFSTATAQDSAIGLLKFFPIDHSSAEGFDNTTTLEIALTESGSSNSIIGFFKEYEGRPFFDWASWKLAFIGAFISMIIITIVFSKAAEVGRSDTGEFMPMAIMLLVGTPILTFIYRMLLI